MIRARTMRGLLSLGVAALMALSGALIYTQLLPQRGPLRWDEGVHTFKGMVIAYDVASWDWLAFLYDSYRQVLYPPLHSWLVATAYLLAGPSIHTAALVSLVLFVLGGGILYLAGSEVRPQPVNWAGAMAALLWLTSPALIDFSTAIMLEVPGLVALSLAILVFLRLLRDPDAHPHEYLLLGATIALTYFMRTPYGIILILAVGITLLVEVRGRVRQLWQPRVFYLALPLVLLFAIWFAYPAKLASTWTWLINYPDGVDDPYGAEGWLYYPLALVRIAGSPWLLALYLGGMVYGLVERRPGPRFLVILVLIQVTLGEFHQNKQARYMFPVLPAWYLLAGNLIVGAGVWLAARRRAAARWAALAVGLLLIVQSGLLLAQALQNTRPDQPDRVGDYVIQALDLARSSLVISTMDIGNPSPSFLDWRLTGEQGLMSAPAAGSAAQIEEGRRLAGIVARLPLPETWAAALHRVFTGYDQPHTVRTLYLGLPSRASYSQGPDMAAAFVTTLLQEQAIERVIVMTSSQPQARYPLGWLVPGLTAAGWQRVDGMVFGARGVQVDIYTQTP